MSSFVCPTVSHIESIAQSILKEFPEERIFAFYGQMGAGKTTFIKKFCEQLHVVVNTSSPTFAIVNDYPTENDESVYHFDFYRIKNRAEALDIGFEEYLYSGYYCLIEWSEKVEDILPDTYVKVEIKVSENEDRIIHVNKK